MIPTPDTSEAAQILNLKKHVGAIQMHAKLTLLQRKLVNVLMYNAYDELLSSETHKMSVSDCSILAGFDSKNTAVLKESIRGLRGKEVEWNVVDADGHDAWGTSSLIAGAEIKNGTIEYSFEPILKRRLYNPEIYSTLNMAINKSFNSTYGHALYENCSRYKKVMSTGWLDLDMFKKLMGLKETEYSVFRDLKRRVINVAVKEVNQLSDLNVEPEFKKHGRKVVAIKFIIKENRQLPLLIDFDTPGFKSKPELTEDALLQSLINDIGFTKTLANSFIKKYGHDYVEGNLKYVKSKLEQGQLIENVAGYMKKALEIDYRPKASLMEKELQTKKMLKEKEVKKLTTLKAQHDKIVATKVTKFIKTLTTESKDKLVAEFVASMEKNEPLVYQKSITQGIENKMVAAFFRNYVLSCGLVQAPNFDEYCQQHQSNNKAPELELV